MYENLLEEALDAWTDARTGIIREVRNIPADRFDFRPAEGVRSVSELVRHILEVSEMMVGELTREDTDFHRMPFEELMALHGSEIADLHEKDALLQALERTLEIGVAEFRRVGELHMLQLIERFDRQKGTRLAWMYHGIAQEMYHRGQLVTYQRLLGLVPALTQRIRGG
ncbi:MAG: hypothetical protein GY856_13220 [bacterium]|nr:hypothetical protein [bacterium]